MEKTIINIKLIDLGRNKINKKVEIECSKGLYNDSIEDTLAEISSHYLLSSSIEVEPTERKNFYSVFAGFQKVGEIEVLDDYIISENGKVILLEINPV
jgi:hypothetical protein